MTGRRRGTAWQNDSPEKSRRAGQPAAPACCAFGLGDKHSKNVKLESRGVLCEVSTTACPNASIKSRGNK